MSPRKRKRGVTNGEKSQKKNKSAVVTDHDDEGPKSHYQLMTSEQYVRLARANTIITC